MNACKLINCIGRAGHHGLKFRRLPNYTSRALLTFDANSQNNNSNENNKSDNRFKTASIFAFTGLIGIYYPT